MEFWQTVVLGVNATTLLGVGGLIFASGKFVQSQKGFQQQTLKELSQINEHLKESNGRLTAGEGRMSRIEGICEARRMQGCV